MMRKLFTPLFLSVFLSLSAQDNLYIDKSKTWKISYPEHWTLEESTRGETVLHLADSTQTAHLLVLQTKSDKALEKAEAEAEERRMQSQFKEYHKISAKFATSHGQEVFERAFTFFNTQKSEIQYQKEMRFWKDNILYLVLYNCPQKDQNRFREIQNKMTNSFQFIEYQKDRCREETYGIFYSARTELQNGVENNCFQTREFMGKDTLTALKTWTSECAYDLTILSSSTPSIPVGETTHIHITEVGKDHFSYIWELGTDRGESTLYRREAK